MPRGAYESRIRAEVIDSRPRRRSGELRQHPDMLNVILCGGQRWEMEPHMDSAMCFQDSETLESRCAHPHSHDIDSILDIRNLILNTCPPGHNAPRPCPTAYENGCGQRYGM